MILKNYFFIFSLLFFLKINSSEKYCFDNIYNKIKEILCINRKLNNELKTHKELYNKEYEIYKKFYEKQLHDVIFKITLNNENRFEEIISLKSLKNEQDNLEFLKHKYKKDKNDVLNFIDIFPKSDESQHLSKLIENFNYFYDKKFFYLKEH